MTHRPSHPSWTPSATAALSRVVDAHGGWQAWDAAGLFHLEVERLGGLLMFLKGLGRTFRAPQSIIVQPKLRRVVLVYDDHEDTYEDGAVSCPRSSLRVADGRTLFSGGTFERWDAARAAYFFGYAFSCYLSYPFSLVHCRLVSHAERNGELTLEVDFPANAHVHSTRQRFLFGKDGLLVRHDYRARLAGPLVWGVHYTSDYVPVQGIQVARCRMARAGLGRIDTRIPGLRGFLTPIS
jgi:hypothetical protein